MTTIAPYVILRTDRAKEWNVLPGRCEGGVVFPADRAFRERFIREGEGQDGIRCYAFTDEGRIFATTFPSTCSKRIAYWDMSEKIYKAARERGRVHLISYASEIRKPWDCSILFFPERKTPHRYNLPPGMYTPNPHRKEAEELAVKAFTLMQRGMMSGQRT